MMGRIGMTIRNLWLDIKDCIWPPKPLTEEELDEDAKAFAREWCCALGLDPDGGDDKKNQTKNMTNEL